jgi:hypothetical protein
MLLSNCHTATVHVADSFPLTSSCCCRMFSWGITYWVVQLGCNRWDGCDDSRAAGQEVEVVVPEPPGTWQQRRESWASSTSKTTALDNPENMECVIDCATTAGKVKSCVYEHTTQCLAGPAGAVPYSPSCSTLVSFPCCSYGYTGTSGHRTWMSSPQMLTSSRVERHQVVCAAFQELVLVRPPASRIHLPACRGVTLSTMVLLAVLGYCVLAYCCSSR